MGLEQQIVLVVEQAVKEALEGLKTAQNGKEDDCLLTTQQAADLLGCSDEYIRHLQDKDILPLRFLPGSKKIRRVLKSEVMELIKNSDARGKKLKK